MNSPSDPADSPHAASLPGNTSRAPGGNIAERVRVLLVSPDAAARAAVRRALVEENKAADVTELDDVRHVVAKLSGGRIDCVLLDGSAGSAAVLDVMRQARTAGVRAPVIVLVDPDPPGRAAGDDLIAAGACDVLVRGEYSPSQLARRIRAVARWGKAEARARRIGAELQESEDRFRMMADNAPVLLWVAGADAKRTWFNQGWLAYTGRLLGDEVGEGWAKGVHPDDLAATLSACAGNVLSRRPFEMEYRLRRGDGEFRWISDKGTPRSLADGTFVGFVGSCVDVTERRRTEEALREANHALEALIRASPLAIYTLDSTGVVKTWNAAAERIFGFTEEDAVGRRLPIVSPEKSAEFDSLRSRAVAGEKLADVEVVRRRKDGSEIDVSISVAPLYAGDGAVLGVVGMAADITGRKHAEHERLALLERERQARADAEAAQRRLAFLAEASEVLASSLDYHSTLASVARLSVPHLATWCTVDMAGPDGRLERLAVAHVDAEKVHAAWDLHRRYPMNPRGAHGVYGVLRSGKSELYPEVDDGMIVAAAVDEDHLRALRNVCMRSVMVVPLNARGQTLGVMTFVACEGDRQYGAADLALAEDLARRAAAAVDNAMLYSEAKAALAEKERSSAVLDTLLRTAPVGMAFFDTDFRYVRINEALAEINGIPRERHLGRTFKEMLPENWVVCEPLLRKVLATGRPVTDTEVTGRTPAAPGVDRHWDCSFYPVRGGDGKIVGVGAVVAEITERKRFEQELTSAKDAAESANRAKDQFLAVLSHELRTPLTPVLTTAVALLKESELPADVKSGLEMIRRNVELEARLIDDLLDLTRIAKGKLRLNLETVDVHASVVGALEICRDDLAGKDLHVTLELAAARRAVRADAARLQQVFWNLIKNAVKFTPEGGRIAIRSVDADDRVRLEIRDTGIGIDEEVLPRIFFAFEQAEQSITRRFGGLGLGLAISKSLIDMHGGRLSAASAGRGAGATFTIELTTVEAAVPRPPRPAATGRAGEGGARLRILMVDDHEDTSRAMKWLLEKSGYHVQVANSVQSALGEAGKSPFDLLISDIGLPDGSGLDLMRQLCGSKHIKGIALSGFGMEDDVRKSKEAGFLEHLTKPVNFDKLEAVIQQIISG